MCDVYCKVMVYWFMFGGFWIAAIIPILHEMEGGEIKNLNCCQLKSLYFDYVKYRDTLAKGISCCSVLEYFNANKEKYNE